MRPRRLPAHIEAVIAKWEAALAKFPSSDMFRDTHRPPIGARSLTTHVSGQVEDRVPYASTDGDGVSHEDVRRHRHPDPPTSGTRPKNRESLVRAPVPRRHGLAAR